jgi:hypothetical protein
MANNFNSNITRPLARVFLDAVDRKRVLSKAVNTQLFQGRFTPASGSTVDVKRPHQYRALETSGGDISLSTKNDIISGKASATVQNMITIPLEWDIYDEALNMDQLEEMIAPAAAEAVTRMETNLGSFMYKNAGLSYGAPGTAIDAWTDVAGAGALMQATGVPMDDVYYVMNPFVNIALSSAQNGLNASDQLVRTAWEQAQISSNFGGLKAMSSAMLPTYTSGTASDRAGTLSATPTATYVSVKDTMTQSLAVTAFSAGATITAGEIVEITGKFRVNLATREVVLDAAGAAVKWRATVTSTVTLDSAGAGTIVVTGPAVFESNGQYNTVNAALASGDVITVLGSASTVYQPSMFFHKNAFSVATVKLPKLYSTDTIATTFDGISVRVSKYADGDANKNMVRFDLLPAFACLNPLFAGKGFGV